MALGCRIPNGHSHTYHCPGQMQKWNDPEMALNLPPVNYQYEPMSDYGTYWTAEGFIRVQVSACK